MSSSRLVSGIKVPAQRTVERGDDLIPGDALCPLFLALLLPSRCAYIRSCKLNIAPISSRMMNRLKENKATIIAFLLSFFSFLHTNLAPQNFPKIPSFRSIFLLPSWRKVKRRRPLSLSPFSRKRFKRMKKGRLWTKFVPFEGRRVVKFSRISSSSSRERKRKGGREVTGDFLLLPPLLLAAGGGNILARDGWGCTGNQDSFSCSGIRRLTEATYPTVLILDRARGKSRARKSRIFDPSI